MKVESIFLAILMYPTAGYLLFPVKCNYEHMANPDGDFRCRSHYYISGIGMKTNVSGRQESSQLLNEQITNPFIIHCCVAPSIWVTHNIQVVYADWDSILDLSNRWVKCPTGYFLNGFYAGFPFRGLISDIENGRCVKPAFHPNHYGHCYNKEFSGCFNGTIHCKCEDNYYVVGLYKKICDDLKCLDVLKCCKMAEKSDEPDELYKAKARVMDRTIRNIASLANSLGYGNCLGCRAHFIGEGFSRDGDTWRADKNRGCEGINPYQRLAIAYSDWGFSIKEVKYEKPVIVLLAPEIIDSGTLYNDDDTDVEKSIQRSEASVRSVTHTPTSSWKQGHELGVTVSYESPFGLSVSGSYAFNYEKSTSTTDERGQEQTNTIVVNTKKTVKPHTAVKWNLFVAKARTTVVYRLQSK